MSEYTTPWHVTPAESCTWFDRYRIVVHPDHACMAYETLYVYDDDDRDIESEFGASMDITMLRGLRDIIDRAIGEMEKEVSE